MQHSSSHTLQSLLSVLDDKKVCNIAISLRSLVKTRSLNLLLPPS